MSERPLPINSLIESIINGSMAYENLTLEQQATIYETLLAKGGKPPEATLLIASQRRPHKFTYVRNEINCPMDQIVYKVKPHQLVMVSFEQPSHGYSRAQAGFLSAVMETSLMDPTITIAKLLPGSLGGIDTSKLSKEEVQALLLKDVLEHGGVEDIGIDEKHRLIEQIRGQGYSIVTVVGEVKEPPSYKNDGVLRLTDAKEHELDIDMSNARLLHVIGVNVPAVKNITPQNN